MISYAQTLRGDGHLHCRWCWRKGPLRVVDGHYAQDEGCGGASCPCHLIEAERERVIQAAAVIIDSGDDLLGWQDRLRAAVAP